MDSPAFIVIRDFIHELSEEFPKTKSIKMYDRLVSKISSKEHQLTDRHLELFKTFGRVNHECIHKKELPFAQPTVQFSENIYINMDKVMQSVDEATAAVIWKYLFTINVLLNRDVISTESLEDMLSGDIAPETVTNLMQSAMQGDYDGMLLKAIQMLAQYRPLVSEKATELQERIKSGDLDVVDIIETGFELVDNMKNNPAEMKNEIEKLVQIVQSLQT